MIPLVSCKDVFIGKTKEPAAPQSRMSTTVKTFTKYESAEASYTILNAYVMNWNGGKLNCIHS